MTETGTTKFPVIIFLVISICFVACSEPRDRIDPLLEQASVQIVNKEFDKAAESIAKALAQDDENADALFLLGKIAVQQKNRPAAAQAFNRALAVRPEHRESRLAMAGLLLANKQYDQARFHIEQALRADPDDDQALILKCRQLLSQNQFQQAESVLMEMRGAGKMSPEFFLMLASAKAGQNDATGAEKVLQEGIDAFPEAVPLHSALVRLFRQTQRTDEAVWELQRIMGLAPDNFAYPLALAALYWDGQKIEEAEAVLRDIIQNNPGNVKGRLLVADFYLNHKQFERAEQTLHASIKDLPDQSPLYLALNRLYQATGRASKAIDILLSFPGAVDQTSGKSLQDIHLALARTYVHYQKIDKAMEYTEKVLVHHPDQVDAMYLKGRIEAARGNIDQAISAFKAVVSKRPDLEEGYLQLAQVYVLDGNPSFAVGILQQGIKAFPSSKPMHLALARACLARKDYKGAEAELLTVVKIDPKDVQIQAELGDFYAQLKNFSRAEREYAEIVSKFPDKALGYLKLAGLYRSRQAYPEALAELGRGYQQCPDKGLLLTDLVRTHLIAGNPETGIEVCQKHLEQNEQDALPYNLMGQIYVRQKQFHKAGKAYAKAIELAPRWDEPNNNLAALFLLQAKKEKANDTLTSALSKNPQNAPAYLMLGRLYEQDGQYDNAMNLYEKGLKNVREFGDAAHRLAALLCEYGDGAADLERSFLLALQAYQLDKSRRADIVETLGWILFHKNEHERAQRLIEQVAALMPDDPLVNYHLGMVLLERGHREDARKKLETALRSDTLFLGRSEAEKALQALKTSG